MRSAEEFAKYLETLPTHAHVVEAIADRDFGILRELAHDLPLQTISGLYPCGPMLSEKDIGAQKQALAEQAKTGIWAAAGVTEKGLRI